MKVVYADFDRLDSLGVYNKHVEEAVSQFTNIKAKLCSCEYV